MKIFTTTTALAALLLLTTSANSAEYAAGLGFGTGPGANFALKNKMHFRDDDQVQTRFDIYGIGIDDVDDLDLKGIEYKSDLDVSTAKATMDWYPFSGGASKVFFSGGLAYSTVDIDGDAKLDKSFNVGNTQVNPGDIQGLKLDVDHNPVSPYMGVGWGNRIGENSGFSFMIELGVAVPLSDADVTLTSQDSAGVISAADLKAEQDQIQDDMDGLAAIGSIAVTYHF